jgi:HEAT repeat protein
MRQVLEMGNTLRVRKGLANLLVIGNNLARGNAAIAIGTLRIKSAVPMLIRLLKDPNLRIRCFSASALGKLGDKKALPALRSLSKKKDHAYQRKMVEGAIKKLTS